MQPIAKWLKSLTQLLDSEFERILHQRDQRMRRLLSTASAKDIWEDRSLHVMSSVKVNWLKRLAVLDGKK
jgi:arsenate reductase-like glutaredoxin family protein